MAPSFEEESARLAKLSRAERFEQLIEFPTQHSFTIIGRTANFDQLLRQALTDCGYQEVLLVERPSATGKFLSLTFVLGVANGVELDRLYLALEQLPGLAYLL
jgi:putative lipoic acid-binding regulatory protein